MLVFRKGERNFTGNGNSGDGKFANILLFYEFGIEKLIPCDGFEDQLAPSVSYVSSSSFQCNLQIGKKSSRKERVLVEQRRESVKRRQH